MPHALKKFDKPGVYDAVPMDWYHDDCCVGPSVSASGLEQVAHCPVKHWAFSPLNPRRFVKEETKATNLGRAAHAFALGEPVFSSTFVVSPYDEFRTKEARAWRDSQKLQVLKSDDLDLVKLMAHALKIAPQVARAFENGKPEQSLIWNDKETGIWLKSRPDWLPNDPKMGFIVDYKTAETIEPYRLSNSVFNYGYHVQGAMQVDGVKAVMGVKPLGIAHVCQEKDPPWLAELRMFNEEQIDLGRKIYRQALRTFADCLSSGKWPGYTKDPTYFQTPYRVAQQAEGFEPNEPSRNRNRGTPEDGYSAADYLGSG